MTKTTIAIGLALIGALMANSMPSQAFLYSNGCPYEDQSGGMGGQAGTCSFPCAGPAGLMTAEVDADDSSAKVSVTGTCGSHDAHCSDTDTCSDNVHYEGSHTGVCEGDSDEITDNGIYINCYVQAEDDTPPAPECLIKKPICIGAPGTWVVDDLPVDSASRLKTVLSVQIIAHGLDAVGFVCNPDACTTVTPQVWQDEAGVHYRIG